MSKMALQKNVVTNTGITADYWKLGMITIDRNLKEFNFSLNLYISKELASKENSFIDTKTFTSVKYDGHEKTNDTTTYDKYIGNNEDVNIIKQCYECAKDMDDFFQDAVDC